MQDMKDMREGFILRYSRDKFIGVIISGDERFFFHRERITRGPIDPSPNSRVLFTTSDIPPLPGKLPYAKNIIILEDARTEISAQDILAGKNDGKAAI
jgi:hypothetical protein